MSDPLRILFALPGFHAVERGAEVALMSVAEELARAGESVTLIGSGGERSGAPYVYKQAALISRKRFERFPQLPTLRNETAWEEASFLPGFFRAYCPEDYDVTVTCSYPWLNWTLRARRSAGRRPAHIFVTQNGDWPARATNSEFRWFGCDGLVCTNGDYFAANEDRYRVALIPNGVDLRRFVPGLPRRELFGLPQDVPLVLMVSAFIASKRVDEGVEAVSRLAGVHLAVAGDGPLRDQLRAKAEQLMPGRFHNFTVPAASMPDLYRSADVFLHLSRDESFGNVFVEAMACGLPTVAWDLPRTRWITGDTGLLVGGDTPQALANALGSAVQRKPDPAPLVARAQGFGWPEIARQYRTFITDVVEQRRRTVPA